MSWDISMRCNHCGTDVEDTDYTYNVAPMFVRAFKHETGIRMLNGMTGASALPLLQAAISDMESARDVYLEMNPPNGWGSYDGALALLRRLAEWCAKRPELTLVVS